MTFPGTVYNETFIVIHCSVFMVADYGETLKYTSLIALYFYNFKEWKTCNTLMIYDNRDINRGFISVEGIMLSLGSKLIAGIKILNAALANTSIKTV